MVYRIFACRCGHGFLRRVEEPETPGCQVPAARRKKRQNEKPKLNVNPKMLSQKGAGEYSPEKVSLSTIRRPATPPSKERPRVQPAKLIPGLSVEGEQTKPLLLNLDLTAIQLTEIKPGDGPGPGQTQDYQPAPTSDNQSVESGQSVESVESGEDIFISDDDLEEEEEDIFISEDDLEEEENKTELCCRLIVENTELRRRNESFELRMLAERRMYQEYQEELLRENQKLERFMQKLKSDLQEKEDKRIETIEELNKLLVTSTEDNDGKQVEGKYDTFIVG